MNPRIRTLLDIADLVLPPIVSLAKEDKTEKLANDVAEVVSSVVGEVKDAKEFEAEMLKNDALVAELKRRLEIVTLSYQDLKNREFIEDQNEALEKRTADLARETADHQRELEKIAEELKDTESARSQALANAQSERWWIRWINPVMSVAIVLAFFFFVHLIATKEMGFSIGGTAAQRGIFLTEDERQELTQDQLKEYDGAYERLEQVFEGTAIQEVTILTDEQLQVLTEEKRDAYNQALSDLQQTFDATLATGGGLTLSEDQRELLTVEQRALFDDALSSLEEQQQQVRDVFYVAFGALATAFVTVIGFHFGSSYGSKRKTQLQRLYGTQGVLSKEEDVRGRVTEGFTREAVDAPDQSPMQKIGGVFADKKSTAIMHPFEKFWMEHLSHIEHFNWRELLEKGASNTGTGINSDPPETLYRNVVPLLNALDKIRKEVGAPVKLISVYRNPAYNAHVGGAENSRHMQFDAADFQVLGNNVGSPKDWSAIAKQLRKEGVFEGGVGTYRTFVHIDTRGTRADWVG
ncbi:D-Ala-D-Ala carboxypeptidase family metallohydrolase [Ruegeria arenilitoris]|uniref:D-Ala-D-Ala carboxypeptidase family metallohydrolase n=1 Tax=Ruegeria arenilitoris TaxID=1173585 RepID=UPI00147E4F89|nr:D-Ala-D-Ala carboxypeptidase family metallohydrolase [Ruegeria arenilitoris]